MSNGSPIPRGARNAFDNSANSPVGASGVAISAALAALAASGGGTLDLAAHTTYLVTSQIDISGMSNVRLRGQGPSTVLNFVGVDIGIGGVSASNMTISDLKIAGTSARAICFTTSSGVVIRSCHITGATSGAFSHTPAGIYMDACDDSVIDDNRLYGNGFGQTPITGVVNGTATFSTLTGIGTAFLAELLPGHTITIYTSPSVSEIRTILAVGGNGSLTLTAPLTNSYAGAQVARAVSSLDVYFTNGGSRNLITRNKATSTAVTMHYGIETNGGGQTCEDNEFIDNRASGAITRLNRTAWGYPYYVYSNGSPITNTTFSGNRARNVGGNGIYLQGATDAIVTENILTNTVTAMTGGALVEGAIAANSTSSGLAIFGNIIRTSGKAGIRCDASNSRVGPNNISDTLGAGILFAVSTTDLSICDNVMSNTAGGGIITVPFTTHLRITINDNTIDGTTGGGAYGIYVETPTVLKMNGNTVNNAGSYGIIVQTPTDYDISHNTVTDASASANNTYDGILLTNCAKGVFHGNKSYNTGITGARYGLSANTMAAASITDNHLAPNVTGPASLVSLTAVTRRGNRLSVAGVLQGRAALVAGTVTVANTEIQTGDDVALSNVVAGGTPGVLSPGVIVNATSLVLNSSNAADTSIVLFEIVH